MPLIKNLKKKNAQKQFVHPWLIKFWRKGKTPLHIARYFNPNWRKPHIISNRTYFTRDQHFTQQMLEIYQHVPPTAASRYISLLWYHLYSNQYMGEFFKNQVFYKHRNILKMVPPSTLSYIMYGFKSVKWKRFYILYGNEIWETLVLAVWIKNLTLLMKWVRKYFESHTIKRHRHLFNFLGFLFGHLLWTYNYLFELKGLRISMRGKFGKAGSVRKTRRYIRRGQCSYSKKNLAFIHRIVFIRTPTGTYSITIEIFF